MGLFGKAQLFSQSTRVLYHFYLPTSKNNLLFLRGYKFGYEPFIWSPLFWYQMKEPQDEVREVIRVPVWDCGSHLYDSYELVSFSHLLDRHVTLLPFLKNSSKQPDCTGFCETDEVTRSRHQKKKAVMRRRIKKEKVKRKSKVIMSSVVKAIACWSD